MFTAEYKDNFGEVMKCKSFLLHSFHPLIILFNLLSAVKVGGNWMDYSSKCFNGKIDRVTFLVHWHKSVATLAFARMQRTWTLLATLGGMSSSVHLPEQNWTRTAFFKFLKQNEFLINWSFIYLCANIQIIHKILTLYRNNKSTFYSN